MSYELVAEKLKTLPEQALEEISHYVDYICTIYVKESEVEKQDKEHRLSLLSNVPYASIRRFEKSGDISLASLVKLALALQLYDDVDNLFNRKQEYQTIEDVINDRKN